MSTPQTNQPAQVTDTQKLGQIAAVSGTLAVFNLVRSARSIDTVGTAAISAMVAILAGNSAWNNQTSNDNQTAQFLCAAYNRPRKLATFVALYNLVQLGHLIHASSKKQFAGNAAKILVATALALAVKGKIRIPEQLAPLVDWVKVRVQNILQRVETTKAITNQGSSTGASSNVSSTTPVAPSSSNAAKPKKLADFLSKPSSNPIVEGTVKLAGIENGTEAESNGFIACAAVTMGLIGIKTGDQITSTDIDSIATQGSERYKTAQPRELGAKEIFENELVVGKATRLEFGAGKTRLDALQESLDQLSAKKKSFGALIKIDSNVYSLWAKDQSNIQLFTTKGYVGKPGIPCTINFQNAKHLARFLNNQNPEWEEARVAPCVLHPQLEAHFDQALATTSTAPTSAATTSTTTSPSSSSSSSSTTPTTTSTPAPARVRTAPPTISPGAEVELEDWTKGASTGSSSHASTSPQTSSTTASSSSSSTPETANTGPDEEESDLPSFGTFGFSKNTAITATAQEKLAKLKDKLSSKLSKMLPSSTPTLASKPSEPTKQPAPYANTMLYFEAPGTKGSIN